MDKNYLYFYNKPVNYNISSAGIAVYRCMLRYANRKTWSCYPSINTLVKDSKYCRRTVIRQLAILEKEGLILKIPRTREKNNGNTSNMYFFN